MLEKRVNGKVLSTCKAASTPQLLVWLSWPGYITVTSDSKVRTLGWLGGWQVLNRGVTGVFNQQG